MFKSKEELIKEFVTSSLERDHGYEKGVVDAFQSFAERKEFYEKYKEESLLFKEQTELWRNGWLCSINGVNAVQYNKEQNVRNYRDWLFDYCFGDVK